MSRAGRLTVCVLACLLCLSLYLKGRVHRQPGDAAFLREDGKTVLVRLAGDFPYPGVYAFPPCATVQSVMNVTLGPRARTSIGGADSESLLMTGSILTLSRARGQVGVVSVKSMGARERLLFGIRLDPDTMGASDWSVLPGIGPALSERIVADRHKNGAFGSLEGVLRVRGVGPGTLSRIRRYF